MRRPLGRGYRVRVLDSLLFDHGDAIAGVLLAALLGDPISRNYAELAGDVGEAGAQRFFNLVAGRRIDRFVFTSTCSNYGLRDSSEPATGESDLASPSVYVGDRPILKLIMADGTDAAAVRDRRSKADW